MGTTATNRHPDRNPIVAGQFYPGDATGLSAAVRGFLDRADPSSHLRPTRIAMAPHAGYVYSGPVAGLTLGRARLHPDVILLGPNHTGMGDPLSIWPGGAWRIPGGELAVHEELTSALIQADPRFTANTTAHAREHSLEVMIPFLHALNPDMRIVPIAVAEPDPTHLFGAARSMAEVIRNHDEPVSIVVSSDMSHFQDLGTTRKLDGLALERIAALDPEGLYATVRDNEISMCGMLPMALAMAVCRDLNQGTDNLEAEIVAYDTSATASGDSSRVVGYAGALIS